MYITQKLGLSFAGNCTSCTPARRQTQGTLENTPEPLKQNTVECTCSAQESWISKRDINLVNKKEISSGENEKKTFAGRICLPGQVKDR